MLLDAVLAKPPAANLVIRRAVHVDSGKRVEKGVKDNYAHVVEKVAKLYRTRRDSNCNTIDDVIIEILPGLPNSDANG